MNVRQQFLQVLAQKLDFKGASIEDGAAFLEVGSNYLYQVRSEKREKNPSAKLLRQLTRYPGPSWRTAQVKNPESAGTDSLRDAPSSYANSAPASAAGQLFYEVQMNDTKIRIPVPEGPDGWERAGSMAAKLAARTVKAKPVTTSSVETILAKEAADDLTRISPAEAKSGSGGAAA